MAYWLVKSEPDSWSWDQQVASGDKGTNWSGVRNHLAKKHLQEHHIRALLPHPTGDQRLHLHQRPSRVTFVVAVVELVDIGALVALAQTELENLSPNEKLIVIVTARCPRAPGGTRSSRRAPHPTRAAT